MLCYITCVMLYNIRTCVMLYKICHYMLYDICYNNKTSETSCLIFYNFEKRETKKYCKWEMIFHK